MKTQYKRGVPQELQDKIDFLINNLPHRKLMRHFHVQEPVSEPTVVPIEGNHLDGYIPHQDGGLEWNALVEPAWCEFVSENHKRYMEVFEEQRDDPSLYQFQIFIDSDEVVAKVTLNFKDAPYYRECYAEELALASFTEEEFMGLSVDSLMRDILQCRFMRNVDMDAQS